MIRIHESKTADTRTCDVTKVSREQLLASSKQHINDVKMGLDLFADMLGSAADDHDYDKITDIKQFHEDFLTKFEQTKWWDAHRKLNRHHLADEDGVPEDVNLIDVLEMIVDCVMAGMGRSGKVTKIEIPEKVLKDAFDNTVELLKSVVVVVKEKEK